MSLRQRESIAGAVAREIDRIDRTGEHHGEGAAYKAAWDRLGSGYFKHCDSFAVDVHLAFRSQQQRYFAAIEEGWRV